MKVRELKQYKEVNMSRAYLVWVIVGENAALPFVQSLLLFYGITKVVSNGYVPILLCRGYPCGYKSTGKAHCGNPHSPTSHISIFPIFAQCPVLLSL